MVRASRPELSLDAVIDQIGMGRFQRKLITVAGVSWAADAMEVLLIGFLVPAIVATWRITRDQAGLLVTALFVGMMVGAWLWGNVADRIGRKAVFVLTILIAAVGGLLSALAPNYETLLLFRVVTGFGIGGSLPVDYAITAEFLPSRQRGRWLVFLESFWALGTIVAAGLALLILPLFPEIGWRIVLAVSALPGLVAFWVRRSIPESPRYLLTQGREEDSRAVLRQVAEANGAQLPADFRLRLAPARPPRAPWRGCSRRPCCAPPSCCPWCGSFCRWPTTASSPGCPASSSNAAPTCAVRARTASSWPWPSCPATSRRPGWSRSGGGE